MIIDYEYLSKVLQVFLTSEKPTVDWNDFKLFWEEAENKLIFHVEILADKNLIINARKDGSLGTRMDSLGEYGMSIVPWRLTATGHDFAAALIKPIVMATIQEKFKVGGITTVPEASIYVLLFPNIFDSIDQMYDGIYEGVSYYFLRALGINNDLMHPCAYLCL